MSTTVYLAPTAGCLYQAFAATGLPLNAGLLATYAAGSTTPTATYTTSAGTVQNANPIVLGADGRTPNEVWLLAGTAYRFDLKDSAGNLIQTYDNLYGIGDPGAANQPSPVFGLTGAAGTNTITANASAALTALAVNQLFVLTPAATNTSTATLNITGATNFGAKNIFSNGAALTGGELKIGVPALLEYDGTQLNIIGAQKAAFARVVRTAGNITTTSATLVDVTGATVTITTGGNPVAVGFVASVFADAARTIFFNIAVDGVLQLGTSGLSFDVTAGSSAVNASFTFQTAALSAGSHTIKAQWQVSAGTGTIIATTATAQEFWAQEIK